MQKSILFSLALCSSIWLGPSTDAQAASSTQLTGPEVLWRPREGLIFYLWNEADEAFRATITLRDMETYHQGDRPVYVWALGPDGTVVADKWMRPPRSFVGQERYRDGIYDQGQDFRYRAWHRAFSPGGIPPDRQRNPFLDRPQDLHAHTFDLHVPAAGAGIYRVMILASWDHWVSFTPDRTLPVAIHSGNGPLYVPPGRFADGAFLYVPTFTEHVGLSTTEEIQPFNWTLALYDPNGTEVAQTTARRFMNFAVVNPDARGDVYRLVVDGDTSGACLHIEGIPPLLAPDAATARLFAGGLQQDNRGRLAAHPFQHRLHQWHDQLVPEELAVEIHNDLDALDDELDLQFLNESLPFFTGQSGERKVRFLDEAGAEIGAMDGMAAGRTVEGLRGVQWLNESDAGVTIWFDRTIDRATVTELASRAGRLHVGVRSLQVPLPAQWQPGDHFRLRYVIIPHETPLAPTDSLRLATVMF